MHPRGSGVDILHDHTNSLSLCRSGWQAGVVVGETGDQTPTKSRFEYVAASRILADVIATAGYHLVGRIRLMGFSERHPAA